MSPCPDSDSAADRGGALAALLPRGGSLLPPSARGLLPGRSCQTQEDLRLDPKTRQPRPPDRQHYPVPAAEAASGLLPSAGREGGVPAPAEKVGDTRVSRSMEARGEVFVRRQLQRLINSLAALGTLIGRSVLFVSYSLSMCVYLKVTILHDWYQRAFV